MGSKDSETSVINYYYSLRNNPEAGRFRFLNSAYLTKVLCLLLKKYIHFVTLSSRRLVRVMLLMTYEIESFA